MAYLFPWIFLIVGSLVAGVGLFIWAFHNGQFSDQGRARYLPLRESDTGTAKGNPIQNPRVPYELFALLTSAISIFLFTIVLVALNGKGG